METNKIWPYCRAMTKLAYNPIKPTRETAINTVITAIEQGSPIIVSGTHLHNFDANTTIGKSTLFSLNEWKNYLSRRGLSAYHHNNHHRMRIDYEPRKIPDDFDIYIFDEIFNFFPGKGSYLEPNQLMPFWDKVATLIKNRKMVIFITALHPQSFLYEDFLCKEEPWSSMGQFFSDYQESPGLTAIREFFFSPVIELPTMYEIFIENLRYIFRKKQQRRIIQ